jgi:hypothetical protein
MNPSTEAADQVVRMTLNGVEVAARITGSGAKELALLLYALLKEQKKTKGKARLSSMLRSGKELKVFAVKEGNLKVFCEEAKKYGVLYCVLKDKNATDGLTDIMVRAEDASKINRIFERFHLANVDMASIRSHIQRAVPPAEKEPESGKDASAPNPAKGRAERSRPPAPTSGRSRPAGKGADGKERPSVRQTLAQLLQEFRDTPGRTPKLPQRRKER